MNIKSMVSNKVFRFLILIAILALFFIVGRFTDFNVDYFRSFFLQYPLVISGSLFVVLYVVLTFFILFGPKDVLRIVSAIIFGAYISTFLVWVGECLNAVVLFSLSRKLGRDLVAQRFGIDANRLDSSKKDGSFLGIFALRINPLIPFRVMDLCSGLSGVSLKKYMMVVMIASLPRVLWQQMILSDVGAGVFTNPKGMMEYFSEQPRMLYYSCLYFVIVVVLSVISISVKIAQKRSRK